MTKDITYKITKEVAVLSKNKRGYTKEVNFVSWNEEMQNSIYESGIRIESVAEKA
jgi:Uncharacterized protein conserved in bacteria (DUF2128).